MAQSRPFLGRLEPFYGWYKRVIANGMTKKPHKIKTIKNDNKRSNFKKSK